MMTTPAASAESLASYSVPPIELVRARLGDMTLSQMRTLARLSRIPFSTLMKIKHGTTPNPGYETVRQFLPFLTLG